MLLQIYLWGLIPSILVALTIAWEDIKYYYKKNGRYDITIGKILWFVIISISSVIGITSAIVTFLIIADWDAITNVKLFSIKKKITETEDPSYSGQKN